MWHSWFRSIIVLACGFAIVYGIFIAQVGYQSLASHTVDVWNAPIMEEKRILLKNEFLKFMGWDDINNPNKPKIAQRHHRKRKHQETISAQDRKSLDLLIDSNSR